MHFSQLNVEIILQIYEWVSRFSANNKSFEHAREVVPCRILPTFQFSRNIAEVEKKYWKPQVFFFLSQNFFFNSKCKQMLIVNVCLFKVHITSDGVRESMMSDIVSSSNDILLLRIWVRTPLDVEISIEKNLDTSKKN